MCLQVSDKPCTAWFKQDGMHMRRARFCHVIEI
jgi:hypothetical protein